MIERQAERAARLREVLAGMPDQLTRETVARAGAALDRGDDTAAADILAADLDTCRPTITWAEMDLLFRALNLYNSREFDITRYPNLDRRHYVLNELPVVSRGDGDAPPMTCADHHRALGELVQALTARLGPAHFEGPRNLQSHHEDSLALDMLAAILDVDRPALTRQEWDDLRRLLQFYDLDQVLEDEESIHRGDEILAALPVIDS
jgi:hypothetical protein